MSITALPHREGYYLGNKLPLHVLMRTEHALDENAARRRAVSSADALQHYAEEARRRFSEALGGIPYDPSCPLHARTVSTVHGESFDIENVIFQSRPSVYVTANLYLPHQRRNPCGAVLFCPGHADDGKACARYQGVARSIASAGLIVLLMDPIGEGERHSYIEPSIGEEMIHGCTADHQYAGNQIVLAGDAPVRYFISDARRGIDYLLSRPEVDPQAIGVTGSSGGGTMTCNMMVCEPRIKAAAPGTFVSTRRAILRSGQAQDAEQIWMNCGGFDHSDAFACFAPKPCHILAAESDCFPIEGSAETLAEAKRLYGLYRAADSVDMLVDHSTHAYSKPMAAAAAAFFARELNGEGRGEDAGVIEPLEEQQLCCTPTGQVRTSFSDAHFLYDENLAALRGRAEGLSRKDAAAFVRQKMTAFRQPVPLRIREYPRRYASGVISSTYFWFTQEGLPNVGVLMRGSSFAGQTLPVRLCLFDRGTDAIAQNAGLIHNLLQEGNAVFVLDTSGIGQCAPDKCTQQDIHGLFGTLDVLAKHLFVLGDSLAAMRLFDLERASEVLRAIPGLGEVSIVARGRSGILANLYGLLHENTVLDVADSQTVSDIVLNRYYEDFDLPGFILPGIAPYAVKLGI